MPRPHGAEALSDDACLTSVGRTQSQQNDRKLKPYIQHQFYRVYSYTELKRTVR